MEFLYKIELSYGSGGIVAKNGIVSCAKREFKWMMGKTMREVVDYIQRKNGNIIQTAKLEA